MSTVSAMAAIDISSRGNEYKLWVLGRRLRVALFSRPTVNKDAAVEN
jgi:hypothetical protein